MQKSEFIEYKRHPLTVAAMAALYKHKQELVEIILGMDVKESNLLELSNCKGKLELIDQIISHELLESYIEEK